jgi:hypothetical protein
MAAPGWLMGTRFGMASAVISAVVILLSMRPIARFRFTIIAALLTIALVDSLADGYALMNAAAERGVAGSAAAPASVDGVAAGAEAQPEPKADRAHSASAAASSIVAKVIVCGSLAVLVWRSSPPRLIYALAAAFVVLQIALTAFTTERDNLARAMAVLGGLFVAAVALSLVLRRLLDRAGKGKARPR